MRRRSFTIKGVLIAIAGIVAAGGCGREGSARSYEAARVAMGSQLHLTVWTRDEASARAAFDAVFAEFDRLEALMTVWRADSDIARLNAAAGAQPVQVSPETIEVLHEARRISEWTGGKFDVTFAALSGLWKFDQDQDNTVPDAAEVRRRLPLINYRALIVDDRAGTAFLERAGMRVNLGGIGKGYAVERAARLLRDRGIRDFLIQAGGDLYVGGQRGDRPWRLGINDPRGPAGRSFATIDLRDETLSTSGDYERFFIEDGRRYHHIIDPATGEPARGCRSVTIVTDSATLADGLSTGVFVMGADAGIALVERLPNVGAVIVTDKNEVRISSRLRGRLTIVAQPTDAP